MKDDLDCLLYGCGRSVGTGCGFEPPRLHGFNSAFGQTVRLHFHDEDIVSSTICSNYDG
jgi:hypothetical protein